MTSPADPSHLTAIEVERPTTALWARLDDASRVALEQARAVPGEPSE